MDRQPSIADEFVQAMALIEQTFPRQDLNDPHRHAFRNLRDMADRALREGIAQAVRFAVVAEQLRSDLRDKGGG